MATVWLFQGATTLVEMRTNRDDAQSLLEPGIRSKIRIANKVNIFVRSDRRVHTGQLPL